MDIRQIKRLLRTLEASKELRIMRSAGYHPHRYSVEMGNSDKMSPLDSRVAKPNGDIQGTQTVTSRVKNGDIQGQKSGPYKVLTVMNHHEPSKEESLNLGPARFSIQHGAGKRSAGAGANGEGTGSGSSKNRKRSKLWLAIADGCGIHRKVSSQALQIEISRVEAELIRLLGVEEKHLLEYCSWVRGCWRDDWRGAKKQKLQPRMYIDLYGAVIEWKGKLA